MKTYHVHITAEVYLPDVEGETEANAIEAIEKWWWDLSDKERDEYLADASLSFSAFPMGD